MKYCLAIVAMLVISSCTHTPSTHDAINRVNMEFDGQDISAFFVSYGSAYDAKPLHDGGKMYRWISIEPTGNVSSSPTLISPTGHYALQTDDSNGAMVTGYCEVNVRTDSRDRIRTIILINDSVGKFSGSRCAEIFGQPD